MRQSSSGWIVACDGDEFAGAELADAMREAVGLERGASLQLGVSAYDSIGAWIAEQSARIEREAR